MSKKSPLFFIPWAESLSNLFWMSRDLSLPKVFPWQPDSKGWLLQLWLEGTVLRIMISALAFWSKSVDSPATSDKTSGGELSYPGIPFNGNVVAVLQLTNDLKTGISPEGVSQWLKKTPHCWQIRSHWHTLTDFLYLHYVITHRVLGTLELLQLKKYILHITEQYITVSLIADCNTQTEDKISKCVCRK